MALHWADIYAAIYKAKSSPSQIALAEDVSKTTVSEVIRGTRTSHKVAYAIAQITGIPTEKMWPGRYLANPAEYKKLRGNNLRGSLPTQAKQLKTAS